LDVIAFFARQVYWHSHIFCVDEKKMSRVDRRATQRPIIFYYGQG